MLTLSKQKILQKNCYYNDLYNDNWATSRENLSSGFPSKRVSNRSPQLQRISRKLKFHLYQVYICNFPKSE